MRLARVAPAVSSLLIFAAFLIVFTFLLGLGHAGVAYNSDSILPFLLVRDLLQDPSALVDWYPSPAFYVFPDWILAAVLLVGQVPGSAMPLFYGALLLTLYCFAAGALLAAEGRVPVLAGTWGMAAALMIAGGAALLFIDRAISPAAFVALASPHIHTGAVLGTLLSGALLIALLEERAGARAVAALGVAVFVCAFSDFLYLVWFTGPACIVAGLHSWWTGRRGGFRYAILMAALSGAAVVVETLIRGGIALTGYLKAGGSSEGPIRAASFLWVQLRTAVSDADYPLIVTLMVAAALIMRTAFILLSIVQRRTLRDGAFTDLFLGGSCAAALLAPLLTGAFQEAAHWRYFLIVFPLSLLWGLRLSFQAWGKWRGASLHLSWIAAALVVLVSAAASAPALEAGKRLQAPPPLEACLAREGRFEGLGDYWTAKLLMLMTERRVHIVQVTRGGNLFRWDYNGRWFTERADSRAAVRPDFIVMRNLDPNALRTRFGAPARVVDCDGTEIWLYDKVLKETPVQRYLIEARKAPGVVGQVTQQGRTATAGQNARGLLTFGPYVEILPGDYCVRVTYSAVGPGHTWDAVHTSGGSTLAKGLLPPTNGLVEDHTFSLKVDQLLTDFELRTRFSGSGTLSVEQIELTREAKTAN